jgi:hypothetical protein
MALCTQVWVSFYLFNYKWYKKYDVIKKRICYFDNGYFLKYFLFKNILK